MHLVSVWSDLYASTLALYTGRAGGHRWLVASPPQHAGAAARALEALEGKGETVLLVYAGLTPLGMALRQQNDPVLGRGLSGVLVLDRPLSGGPEVTLPGSEQRTEQSGLSYQGGGSAPAWTDALAGRVAQVAGVPEIGEQQMGEQGECAPASVCASLGLPVRVCGPDQLSVTLRQWWAATPHALVPAG